MLDRRSLLAGIGMIGTCATVDAAAASAAAPLRIDEIADLERAHGGRLGVHAIDAGGRVLAACREDERFLFCSTFKLFLAAAVLERVEAGKERLDRRVRFGEGDLLQHAPAVRARLAAGSMTVEELCRAAVVVSDNSAANLLLDGIGGPAAMTGYFRRAGDAVSRIDRREPELNLPTGELDTTTPRAAARLLRRLLTSDSLDPPSRGLIERWMIECTTGVARIRAGLPAAWTAGDKTGTGGAGETNDIAVVRPPGRPPLFVASYYVAPAIPHRQREAVLAKVGAAVARRIMSAS
jgi:beta-lactamase class A